MLLRRWLMLFVLTIAAILIPFFLFGERIEEATARFVQSGAGRWTAAGVLSALLAADVALPVPSSLVSTAAGAMLGLWGGLCASWVGMTAGCAVGYWVGTRAKESGDMERVRRARERYGDAALILFRAIPVLAEASVLFAGFTRIPPLRFLAITGLSNLGISLAYAAAGAYSARRESFLLAFVGATAIPAAGLLVSRALRGLK